METLTTAHLDVRCDLVAMAVALQVALDVLVRQEAGKTLVEGEVREHHGLFGKVRPDQRHDKNLNGTSIDESEMYARILQYEPCMIMWKLFCFEV